MSLFHRYAFIYRPLEGGSWLSANSDWALTDTEILKAAACVHPKYFIGARCGKVSKFVVLDIDAGSKYHNKEGFAKIAALLEQVGIEGYNLYRSSHSGGWHIYIFFDAPVSTRDLYRQFHSLLTLNEFEVAKGTLEIFPNPGEGRNSVGHGLRLPLQPGFAWLNHHNQMVREERDELSPTEALLTFTRDIECSVNPYAHFHKLRAFVENLAPPNVQNQAEENADAKLATVISIRKNADGQGSDALKIVKSAFRKTPPGIKADTWVKGREYYFQGLTGPSQRAEAIFSLSHYLFYGDPANQVAAMGYGFEEERQYLIDSLIKNKHNGQSKDIAAGRGDAFNHIERATNWLPPHLRGTELRKHEPVVPISWIRNNANRASIAQRKIAAAVEDFREANMQFSTRDLSIKCGVSSRTIAKYPELWKQAMEELRTGCLKTALHEYNAVEFKNCSDRVGDSFDVFGAVFSESVDRPVQQSSSDLSLLSFPNSLSSKTIAQRSLKPSSDNWRDRVDVVSRFNRSRTTEGALLVQINLLAKELLTAPTRKDWIWLSSKISLLKEKVLSEGYAVQMYLGEVDTA